MLYVHWSCFSSSDTVVVLSRDITIHSSSTSYLYISNDYGKNYRNQSDKFKYKKGGATKFGLVEKFYASPVDPKRVSSNNDQDWLKWKLRTKIHAPANFRLCIYIVYIIILYCTTQNNLTKNAFRMSSEHLHVHVYIVHKVGDLRCFPKFSVIHTLFSTLFLSAMGKLSTYANNFIKVFSS